MAQNRHAALPNDNVTMMELRGVDEVTVYKVLPGLNTMSLMEFNAACQLRHRSSDQQPNNGSVDRRAIYTQFRRKHVLGTVPYKWETRQGEDNNTRYATLKAITFRHLDILAFDGPLMHDGTVSGKEKATAIKSILATVQESTDEAPCPQSQTSTTAPSLLPSLMDELGRRGKAAMIRETDDEWELVLPHNLLETIRSAGGAPAAEQYSEVAVAYFRRHSTMPVTDRWKPARMADDSASSVSADDGWLKWDDDDEENDTTGLAECIPDLPTRWLEEERFRVANMALH